MNNINPDLNALKLECQELMPLVHLLKNKAPANSFSGLERDQKLSIMGFSPNQIRAMTGQESTTPFLGKSTKESRLRSMGKEICEKMDALKARTDKEFEQEYSRMLEYGIKRGFIEDEPKLRIFQQS